MLAGPTSFFGISFPCHSADWWQGGGPEDRGPPPPLGGLATLYISLPFCPQDNPVKYVMLRKSTLSRTSNVLHGRLEILTQISQLVHCLAPILAETNIEITRIVYF